MNGSNNCLGKPMDTDKTDEAAKRKAACPTIGGVVIRAFLLICALWVFVPWIWGLCTVSGECWLDGPPPGARRQLASLRRRLDAGEAARMQSFFPEGRLFSYSFYGLAVVNVASAAEPDSDWRRWAVGELEWVIPEVTRCAEMDGFVRCANLRPRGGIIPPGQLNLLRAGYALLGGTRAEIIADFHATSALLFEEYAKTTTGSLETFPAMIWPVDNVCALESLRYHDKLFGTDYGKACRKWERWMAEHVDEQTGMMVAQIAADGTVLDRPRGCALSWSLAFMPGFAPELARAQYERYRREWFIDVLGSTGMREYPEGREVVVDVDTGPMLGDIGTAASAFGIAAARANGDYECFGRMVRGLEAMGVPSRTLTGAKEHFFGAFLLPDVLAFWAKTARIWDKPLPPTGSFPARNSAGQWWWVVLTVCILAIVIVGLLALTARRALRALRSAGGISRRRAALVIGMQCGLIAAWLATSVLSWPMTIFGLCVVAIVEERIARRAVAA
jgi:linalool dehydratase/isomerase-like protein